MPTNNNGDRYVLSWRLPTGQDVAKKPAALESGRGEASEEAPLINQVEGKAPRPDAPWAKEEPEEFEDLQEGDIAKKTEELADRALISAVKTVAELSRAQDLQAYSRHPKIMPKFLADNEYKTQITFGMHVGHAVEGSVGTEMKIDPLYLSQDA